MVTVCHGLYEQIGQSHETNRDEWLFFIRKYDAFSCVWPICWGPLHVQSKVILGYFLPCIYTSKNTRLQTKLVTDIALLYNDNNNKDFY